MITTYRPICGHSSTMPKSLSQGLTAMMYFRRLQSSSSTQVYQYSNQQQSGSESEGR